MGITLASKVGIIANPIAGEDIRRLVAYGIAYTNMQKAEVVREIILGIDSMDVDEILIMPEYFGIGYFALDRIYKKLNPEISFLDMPVRNLPEDSTDAAKIMNELNVGCIVVVGGDGTNRAVAKGCGRVPILPIAAGTNNVLPYIMEGTISGVVAGYIAKNPHKSELLIKLKRLEVIKNGVSADIALIDAVVCSELFIGSRALWDIEKIKQIVATVGSPTRIGMSSIGAFIRPIERTDTKHGIYIKIGEGKIRVKAPIAPGIVEEVSVKEFKVLDVGDKVRVEFTPSMVALDGERELYVGKTDDVEIKLSNDGPCLVDVAKTLKKIVRNQEGDSIKTGKKVINSLNQPKNR